MKSITNMTIVQARLNVILILILILTAIFVQSSCTKSHDEFAVGSGDKVKLNLYVDGLKKDENDLNSGIRFSNELIKSREFKINGFNAALRSGSEISLSENKLSPALFGSGKIPMERNKTYRLLFFHKKNMKFVTSVIAKVGEQIEIEVNRGQEYLWYAYSYNDFEEIELPKDIKHLEIQTPQDRDFLYASGQVEASQEYNPIAITFEHKLSLIEIEINMEGMYSDILELDCSIEKSDFINQGTFDLLLNETNQIQRYEIKKLMFTNKDSGNHKVKVARFYSAKPDGIKTLEVSINKFKVKYPNNKIIEIVKEGKVEKVSFAPANLNAGKLFKAELVIWKVFSKKKIIHLTKDYFYGYAGEIKASNNLLIQPRNFGLTSNSIVKIQGFESVIVRKNYGLLAELNSPQKPDIVIIAFNYAMDNAEVDALISFANEGGVVLLFSDYSAGAEIYFHLDFLKSILNNNSLKFIVYGYPGSVFPLSSINDKVLNGPFGDIRKKNWGEDASNTIFLSNVVESDEISVYSRANALNVLPQEGITMFRHNLKNIFWIGDGGWLSNEFRNGAYPSFTIEPFVINAQDFPVQKERYGHAGNGYAIGSMPVQNSILFANLMNWAVFQAEFFGINTLH